MEEAVRLLGLREIIKIPENLFIEGGDVFHYSTAPSIHNYTLSD